MVEHWRRGACGGAPASARADRVDAQGQDGVSPRRRAAHVRAGRYRGHPRRRGARGLDPRGHRGDRRLLAAARGFSGRRQAPLYDPDRMSDPLSSWQLWAVLSAVFAALTAIFAKIGVENVNADFATFVRTIVILATLALILFATGQFQAPGSVSARTYLFL